MTATTPTGRLLVRRPTRTLQEATRHARRRRALEIGLAITIPLALLLLWQLAVVAGWIDGRLFTAPTEIARTAVGLFVRGELWTDIVITLRRIVIGFVIGVAVGFTVGSLMGLSRLVRKALEPMLNALYVIPKLALLPVFITIFGLGEPPIIVLVAVTVAQHLQAPHLHRCAAACGTAAALRGHARGDQCGRAGDRGFGDGGGQHRARLHHLQLPGTVPEPADVRGDRDRVDHRRAPGSPDHGDRPTAHPVGRPQPLDPLTPFPIPFSPDSLLP